MSNARGDRGSSVGEAGSTGVDEMEFGSDMSSGSWGATQAHEDVDAFRDAPSGLDFFEDASRFNVTTGVPAEQEWDLVAARAGRAVGELLAGMGDGADDDLSDDAFMDAGFAADAADAASVNRGAGEAHDADEGAEAEAEAEADAEAEEGDEDVEFINVSEYLSLTTLEKVQEAPFYITTSSTEFAPAMLPHVPYCMNSQLTWSVTSARPDAAVHNLISPDPDTFWQSDGVLPHSIVLEFHKRMSVAEIVLVLDFEHDESYTPTDIHIRAGSLLATMKEVVRLRLQEPWGCVHIPLLVPDAKGVGMYTRAHMLQIVILGNHQQGRDSRIHHVRVMGPHPRDVSLTAGGPVIPPADLVMPLPPPMFFNRMR